MTCKNSEIVAASVIEASLKDPKIFNKITDWSGKITNAKKAVKFFSGKDATMVKNAEAVLKDNQRQLNTFLFGVALKDRTQVFKVLEMLEKSSLPEKASIVRFMNDIDITNIEQSTFIRDVVGNITQDSIVKYQDAMNNLSMNRFLEVTDNQSPDFIENSIKKGDGVESVIDSEDLLYKILDESNDYLALTDTVSRAVKVITTSNEKEKLYTTIQKKFIDIVNAEQGLKLTDDEVSEVLEISDRLINATKYVAGAIETNLAKGLELALMAKYLDNTGFQLDKSGNTLKKAKFFNDSLTEQFSFYLQKKQEGLTDEGIEQAFKEKYTGENYNKYGISTNLMTKGKTLATKPSDFAQNINHIFSMLGMSDNVLRSDAYVNSLFDYLETIKGSSQATEILNEIDNLKKTQLGGLSVDNKKAFLKDFSNKIDAFLKEKYASKGNISTDILQYVLGVGRIDDPTKAFFLDTYVESGELGNLSGKLQDAGMYKVVVGGANYKLSSKDLEDAKKILADSQDRLNIKTNNPIINGILSGSIKDLFIGNATKKDFLGDLNKFIDKYNGVKDNAKVQLRYPSIAQTYSLDFVDGQLIVKVDHPGDYNTLISRISFISNTDAIKQLKVMNPDVNYTKLLQDKLSMEGYNADGVIDLFDNKYGDNKLSIVNNKLEVSQSVSGYGFQREIINIADKKNELMNMKDFRGFLNEKIKETAKLFGLDTAADISGRGLISRNGFYIPKNKENLINNMLDMLYSESVTHKVDSLQKVMTEVGIFKSNIPYSISDNASKIDLFEKTILNFDKKGYRVSTYNRTDKALERVLNNSDKIQNWDDDVFKLVKSNKEVENFLSGVIGKNLIVVAEQQSDAYKGILQTLVTSMEEEMLKGNVFATKNIGADFRIDASLQLLKDKAINMSKDDFLVYFANIKKTYDDFMANQFISTEENNLIKQIEKIEESEQRLGKKWLGNKRVKITDKEEKASQSIAHSAKKERLLETIQQQYGIYDANRAVDKYDELVNTSISMRTRKPEVDLARMEREPEEFYDNVNKIKSVSEQPEYRLAYLNDIDSAYNSIKADLVEGEMFDNKPFDAIKDPESYKKQMNNITLEYEQIANKLKSDYDSAKTVAEKSEIIQKASGIKKTFTRKVDSLEQKFYKDYKGFTKGSDYVSSKSNVVLIDVTGDLGNIGKGLTDINKSFSSKVDEINNNYKIWSNKQAVADRQTMDKVKMDSLFDKGYYITSIDGKPNYVSIDNVLQDSINSIPRGFSEDIDAIRDIDIKSMGLQEKLQYLKIFKSAESYYDATRASKASVIRGKINPLLVDFDEVSKLVDVDINTSLLIDNLYSKTKLPTGISKQSQNFIDSFVNTAKDIGGNQLDHISDARGTDLFIKRKIFESVSNSLNKREFTMDKFEKIYDKIISDIKVGKGGLLPSDVLSKMDYPETYRQELRDVFYKYSQLPSFDITNLSQIDNRVTYNSEIISRLSAEDKQIIGQIRTKNGDSILSVYPSAPTRSETLIDELEAAQPKEVMDVQEKAIKTANLDVDAKSVDSTIVEERQVAKNIKESIRINYAAGLTATKTILNKTKFGQGLSSVIYDLSAPGQKIEMLLDQLFNQGTEVVQNCITLLKGYENNGYFVGMKIPDGRNNAETAAYFIGEYLNTLKTRMSTLGGIIDPDLQDGLDNIHKLLLRITSREEVKAISDCGIFGNVRIFEMARMVNGNLRKSGKLKDIGGVLDDVTYKFIREQFGNGLSDGEVKRLYSSLVSVELSGFNKFFGNKRLTGAANLSKGLAGFSAGGAITAGLQGVGRVETSAFDWIRGVGKGRKYKDVRDIMDRIGRGEIEGGDLRQLWKGDQTTKPGEGFIHVLNRDFAYKQAKDENIYGFQQIADFTFRHFRKAKSLNDAIWAVKKMMPEEFRRWLEVVPDSPAKTETIDKIKSLASDIFVGIEGIGGGALNQVQEGGILGWYNRIYDFRGFRGQQMVKNIFNGLGTVTYSAKVYYDAIRQGEGHAGAMERLAKFWADNYESKIMLQDMYKNIYLTAKARNLRADEKNGKENRTVKDEMKNFFTALGYTSPYFASFSSTSIGRTLGKLWDSYGVGGKAYDPNGKGPGYEAYANFTKFAGEMFKEYKALGKRSLYLIQAFKDGVKGDKDLETIMSEFFFDQSLGFQRYVTAEIIDATGREVMPKARGKNLGFLSDKDTDRMDVKYDQSLYSNWIQRKKEDFPRASIVVQDGLAKLPIVAQILSSQYGNSKDVDTYIEYADKDPIYASFYKNGTIDFKNIKNNVGGNRAKMRDEIWNPLIGKSEGGQQFIGAGNAKEYLNAMQSAGVQNVYVESFLKSLGGEKATELIYSLDFAKNNNDEKLKEAGAIINALAQKDGKTEEEAIGVYRGLLGYIARQYYDNRVADVKDRNKKIFGKKEIGDREKDMIKDDFITTVGTIIPKVDTQFGNEIMQDYIYYDPRTPEKVKQFYDRKSYKDNETGMELEDHYLTQKWKSALLTEYFTKKAAYNGDVNAYLEKNTFGNLTNNLTPQEKVAVYLDTFKKLDSLGISKDIIIGLKGGVLGANPDMIDAHADLEKADPEMANELKNDLYGTYNDAYNLGQAIMSGADIDKGKSNSVSRSTKFSLEKSTDISKFINTIKSKGDDYLQFNETKNAKGNIRAAGNGIPTARRKFIIDSAKMRDAISGKGTTATSTVYGGIANKGKSVGNNITKPKATVKFKANKSKPKSVKSKATS